MPRLSPLWRHPVLKVLLLLPVSVFLLYLAFRDVEWEAFLQSFRDAHWGWLSLAIALSVLSYALRSERWRLLLNAQQKSVTVFDAFYGVLFGYFVNLLIPRAGEVARCTLVAQRSAVETERAIGTVISERLVDLLSSVLVTLVAIAISFDRFGSFLWERVLVPFFAKLSYMHLLLLGVAIVALVGFFFLLYYVFRHTRWKERWRAWWQEKRVGFRVGLESLWRQPQKGLFLFYTLLLWLCYWFMAYTTARALLATQMLGLSAALAILVVGTFGMIIPAQGGLGSFHLAVVLWLGVESIARSESLAYAILSHEGQVLLYMGLLALCYMVSWVAKKWNKANG